jgi:hypothetical protein
VRFASQENKKLYCIMAVQAVCSLSYLVLLLVARRVARPGTGVDWYE